MRHLTVRSTILSAVAACLLLASGCAGTTDEEGGTSSDTRQQSKLLLSAFYVNGDGDPAALLFGHTPTERWTYELATVEDESRTRKQYQNDDDLEDEPRTPELTGHFFATSGAVSRFGNLANSGATSRFVASSGARSRFAGSSGATTRFDSTGMATGGGKCDPTAVCDYFDALCDNYPGYEGLNCEAEFVDDCRTNLRRNRKRFRENLEQSVCYFSAVFTCAARGVQNYGRISSEYGLTKAVSQGLRTCRVEADLDTEFNFSTSDSTEN